MVKIVFNTDNKTVVNFQGKIEAQEAMTLILAMLETLPSLVIHMREGDANTALGIMLSMAKDTGMPKAKVEEHIKIYKE